MMPGVPAAARMPCGAVWPVAATRSVTPRIPDPVQPAESAMRRGRLRRSDAGGEAGAGRHGDGGREGAQLEEVDDVELVLGETQELNARPDDVIGAGPYVAHLAHERDVHGASDREAH